MNLETLAIEGSRIRKEVILSNIFLGLVLLKEIIVGISHITFGSHFSIKQYSAILVTTVVECFLHRHYNTHSRHTRSGCMPCNIC